jgi:hypothetical protein
MAHSFKKDRRPSEDGVNPFAAAAIATDLNV